MLASAPADLFAGIDSISASGDDTIDDSLPADEDVPADEPVIDDAPADEDVPTDAPDAPLADDIAAPPPDAAPDEELPEGTIKTKDNKGKYQYRLDENRYKTVYGNHQMVQQLAEVIGEAPTLEALQLRHDTYLANERLYTALESGDPSAQGNAVKFMLDEMRAAHEAGEVGVDPSIPFAQTVYSTLKDNAPDAYANLRFMAARDLVGEMFENAARANNPQLFSSAQHFAATIAGIGPKPANVTPEQYVAHIREVASRSGIPFHTPEEMQGLARGEDPMVQLQRENAQLKQQMNGKGDTSVAERHNAWHTAHIQDVNSSVLNDAVMPSLASVKEQWKDFPADYQRLVVDPLNREVTKAVKSDPGLTQQVNELSQQAKRATSEQVRNAIGERIKQLFVNRAKIAADKVKAPILKFAAEALAGRSSSTHQRRAGAQDRTQPKGPSAPVRTSALPPDLGMKNNVFDPKMAARQAMALLR